MVTIPEFLVSERRAGVPREAVVEVAVELGHSTHFTQLRHAAFVHGMQVPEPQVTVSVLVEYVECVYFATAFGEYLHTECHCHVVQ